MLEMVSNRPAPDPVSELGTSGRAGEGMLGHGSVVIAAITSCTNTSNPSVMLAAGLLARKAVERAHVEELRQGALEADLRPDLLHLAQNAGDFLIVV